MLEKGRVVINPLPKITLVTPSFNQGKYLEKTILSVLNQGYPNLEYIVIDGGSSDDSVEIIRRYENKLAYWVSEPDSGQSNAINKGFAQATGELYGWVNSDDILMEGALAEAAEMYLRKPGAGAYVGAGEYIDVKDRVLLRKDPCEVTTESLYHWLDVFHFMQPSCFFTREAWEFAQGLDESIHYAMDLDLWFKIARGFSFERSDRLFSRSLVHAAAKTRNDKYLSEVDTAFVIMRHGGAEEGRKALEKIALKLDFIERKIRMVTSTRMFDLLLPSLKRVLGYDVTSRRDE